MRTRLTAEPLGPQTKGEVKRMRRDGFVPVSVQHAGRDTLHLKTPSKALEDFILHHGEAALAELDIAKEQPITVVVHDVQRHPISHALIQVTCQGVERNALMKAQVPIKFHGEPDSVKQKSAMIQHQLNQVEIQCLPADLPDHIIVDVSKLEYGQQIHVSDLAASNRYTFTTAPDTLIASLVSLTHGRGTEEPETKEEPLLSA